MSVTLFEGFTFDFGALCSALVMLVLWTIVVALLESI